MHIERQAKRVEDKTHPQQYRDDLNAPRILLLLLLLLSLLLLLGLWGCLGFLLQGVIEVVVLFRGAPPPPLGGTHEKP